MFTLLLISVSLYSAFSQVDCSGGSVVRRVNILDLRSDSVTYFQCDGSMVIFNPSTSNVDLLNNSERWGWDFSSKTLTLGGVDFEVSGSSQFGVTAVGDIVVKDGTENRIRFTTSEDFAATLSMVNPGSISGGGILSVEMVSLGSEIESSDVVWFDDDVVLRDVTLNVTRNDLIDYSIYYNYYEGIYVKTNLTMMSGTLNVVLRGGIGSESADRVNGIYCPTGSLTINGGKVVVEVSDGIEVSRGIRGGNIRINGGYVSVTAGSASTSYGITSGAYNLDIYGGEGVVVSPYRTFNKAPVFGSGIGFSVGNQNTTTTSWDTLYKVSFDANVGEGLMIPQVFVQDIPQPLSVNLFTKVGYSFKGWSTGMSGSVVYGNQEIISATSDMMLYAVWSQNIYSVNFESNGGSEILPITTTYGTLIGAPAENPTRSDYEFGGWYKDEGLTTVWDFDADLVMADITLYARWIREWAVTIDSDNGSIPRVVTINNGELLLYPEDPTKDGFVFAGWFKDSHLWNFGIDVVTESFTLQARWVVAPAEVHRVTLRIDNGTDDPLLYIVNNELIAFPTEPTKFGYLFSGWYREDMTTAWVFTEDRVTSDLTLYAKWRSRNFDVRFEMNDGSEPMSSIVGYNELIVAPSTNRIGYSFDGFYREADFVTRWDLSTDRVLGNLTLYAKWGIHTYHVSFNSNGGSEVPGISVYYNDLASLPSRPIKDNFTFIGWYADEGLSDSWDFMTDRVTDHIVLYAKWVEYRHLVTFHVDGGSMVRCIVIDNGKLVPKPTNPTKVNYVFGGWYKDILMSTSFDFMTDIVTSDITLYARWIASSTTFSVSFNSNGGTSVESIAAGVNTFIAKPLDPFKEGFIFEGWYTDELLSTSWEFGFNRVISDIILYAKWRPLTGIHQERLELSAYPNPTGALLYLDNLDRSSSGVIEIFDIQGSLVFSREVSRVIDISSLRPGIYTVKSGDYLTKIVKVSR